MIVIGEDNSETFVLEDSSPKNETPIVIVGSILQDTKKLLGIPVEYTVFDTDVLIHINSAFFTLQQLGVGPEDGFYVSDDTTTWSEYTGGDVLLNSVKSYVYIKVRLLFDPPATSFLLESLQKQAEEYEWRLNMNRETRDG